MTIQLMLYTTFLWFMRYVTGGLELKPLHPLHPMARCLQEHAEILWRCDFTHYTNCDILISHVINVKVSDSPLLFLMSKSFLISIKNCLKLFY